MKRAFLLLMILTTRAFSQTVGLPPSTPAARIVATLVEHAAADVRDAYAPSGYTLLWTKTGTPTSQAHELMSVLAHAGDKGLNPRDYSVTIPGSSALTMDDAQARFDVAVTAALLRYTNDVSHGRVPPQSVEFDFDHQPKPFYFPAFAAALSTAADIEAALAMLEPQNDEYVALLDALARYRDLASKGDAPPISGVPRVAPGDSFEQLELLASRLRQLGDLPQDAVAEGTVYAGPIVGAVQHFQSRHALEPDGILGRATIEQLNVPLARRAEQIAWSLERWRWVPRTKDDVILINVPSYRLVARGAGGQPLSMRVVVGESAGHRTPMFDGTLRNVVFRPYWGVTANIQRNELLPKIERDRSYLARNGYEIMDGGRPLGRSIDDDILARLRAGSLRIRQKPGSANALGLVKFLFPNDNDIYLHSTPQPELFSRARRDFSHGCIRVEEPAALAAWVLRGQEWPEDRIAKTMHGKRDDVYVKVERPVHVVLMYATASAEAGGKVEFFTDIYGHDQQLAKVLMPRNGGAAVLMASR